MGRQRGRRMGLHARHAGVRESEYPRPEDAQGRAPRPPAFGRLPRAGCRGLVACLAHPAIPPSAPIAVVFVPLAYPVAPLHLLSDGTPFQPRRGERSSMPTGRVKQHVISDISREIVYILLISCLVLLFRSKKFYLRGAPVRGPGRPPPPCRSGPPRAASLAQEQDGNELHDGQCHSGGSLTNDALFPSLCRPRQGARARRRRRRTS